MSAAYVPYYRLCVCVTVIWEELSCTRSNLPMKLKIVQVEMRSLGLIRSHSAQSITHVNQCFPGSFDSVELFLHSSHSTPRFLSLLVLLHHLSLYTLSKQWCNSVQLPLVFFSRALRPSLPRSMPLPLLTTVWQSID